MWSYCLVIFLPGYIPSLTFTDDVALSLTASDINLISNWMKQHRCGSNVDKSQIMIIKVDRALAIPTFVLARQHVEVVSAFKCLGS